MSKEVRGPESGVRGPTRFVRATGLQPSAAVAGALAFVLLAGCAPVVQGRGGTPPQGGGLKPPPGTVPAPLPGRGPAPGDPIRPTPVGRGMAEDLPPDVRAALDELGRVRGDRMVYFQAGRAVRADTGISQGEAPSAAFWLVAELDGAIARKTIVPEDIVLSATVTDAAGHSIANAAGTVSADEPTCMLRFPPLALASGDYTIALAAKSSGRAVTDEVHLRVPPAEDARVGSLLVLRSGPFSTPGFEPTADPRFRKAERLRADAMLAQTPDAVAARLLDRFGRPLRVPATARLRVEQGACVASAEVALAPLAPGDYLVELSARFGAREDRSLVAIRIVPS